MKHIIDKRNNMTLLKISGDVNIQNIAELKHLMLELFNNGEEILIDNEHVTEIDLTYYQFLVSVHKFAIDQKKKIKITNSPDCFRKLYDEIGITQNNMLENIFREENE